MFTQLGEAARLKFARRLSRPMQRLPHARLLTYPPRDRDAGKQATCTADVFGGRRRAAGESKLYLLEDAAQQAGHPIEDRAVLLVAVNVCEFRSRLEDLQVMLVESSTSRRGTQAQRALCTLSRQ